MWQRAMTWCYFWLGTWMITWAWHSYMDESYVDCILASWERQKVCITDIVLNILLFLYYLVIHQLDIILFLIFFMTPLFPIHLFICGRPPQIKYHLPQILFLVLLVCSHHARRGYRVSLDMLDMLDMSPTLAAFVLFILSTFYNCLTNFKHVATVPW